MSVKKINPEKATSIAELKDLLSRSKSVAIVDYKGLKVSQATELRKTIRAAGGQVIVTKNTLFSIASGNKDLLLEGPSAFIFSFDDEITAVKVVADFSKKNGVPTFKMGLLADRVLTAAEITTLAELPGKDQLIAKTVSTLFSPVYRLVYSLNWNIAQLVRTLDAIKLAKTS